jgi:hypothetical protein
MVGAFDFARLLRAGITAALALLWLAAAAHAAPPPVSLGPASTTSVGTLDGRVALGNFTGSSALDAVVADQDGGTAEVLPGNGTGGFGTPQPITLTDDADWVATGDLNRDGKLDAIVAADGGDVWVLLQQAGGGLALTQTITSSNTEGVAVADVNGDGIPDILVGQPSGHAGVFYGKGDGSFVTTPQSVSLISSLNQTLDVAATDLDGDGKTDLIGITQADDDSDQVDVARRTSANATAVPPVASPTPATFATGTTTTIGDGVQFPDELTVGDVNGDTAPDLIVTSDGIANATAGAVTVLLNKDDGSGTFATAVTYPTPDTGLNAAAIADLNGDGLPDLAVANNHGSVDLLVNDGAGTFGASTSVPVDPAASEVGVAAGDLNGDGRPDLVVSGGDDSNLDGVVSAMLNTARASARTGSAVEIHGTDATLLGTIDGAGVDVSYRFQYGPESSPTTYPSQTPLGDAFAATGATPEGADVTGLSPHTAYHYRIVAETGSGTVLATGVDRTFTTNGASTSTTGPQGPVGPEGPEGPAGQNGSSTNARHAEIGELLLTEANPLLKGETQTKHGVSATIPITEVDLVSDGSGSAGATIGGSSTAGGAGKATSLLANHLTTTESLHGSANLFEALAINRPYSNAKLALFKPGGNKIEAVITLKQLHPSAITLNADEDSTEMTSEFTFGGEVFAVANGNGGKKLLNSHGIRNGHRVSTHALRSLLRSAGRPRTVHAGRSNGASKSKRLLVALGKQTVSLQNFQLSVKLETGGSNKGAGAGKLQSSPATFVFPDVNSVSRKLASMVGSHSLTKLVVEMPGFKDIVTLAQVRVTRDEISNGTETITSAFGAMQLKSIGVTGTKTTPTSPPGWNVVTNKNLGTVESP